MSVGVGEEGVDGDTGREISLEEAGASETGSGVGAGAGAAGLEDSGKSDGMSS